MAETLLETIETVILENSAFSRQIPGLQIAWDSTSINALKKCPRFYEYEIIHGFISPFESDDLKFGIVFHSATEAYDKARSQNLDHEASLMIALRTAIIETWDFEKSRPWISEKSEKTRDTLFRSIVWYLDHFKDDNLETYILSNGKPAVELSFRFEIALSAPSGEIYTLCGHIDKVSSWNGDLYINDKKTSKYELDNSYFRQFTPNTQISLYTLAGNIILPNTVCNGVIIDAIQVLVTGTRFRRQPIERTEPQLEEWLENLRVIIKQAENYAQNQYWPQNESACGFGHFQCKFRPVCSADPSIRNDLLETLYKRRVWDPLQPR